MKTLELIAQLASAVVDLAKANGDAEKEKEAIMRVQEIAKAELDRRLFGGG